MQIGDVKLLESTNGTGPNILTGATNVRAIQLPTPETDSPPTQGPEKAIDGNPFTKYVGLGGSESGFIVLPGVGYTQVYGLQITTSDADPGFDPLYWELYGTNGGILKADFTQGQAENWTFIDNGTFTFSQSPDGRLTAGSVVNVHNFDGFTGY